MPVKHDLFADLGISKDELTERRSRDARLNKLVEGYDEVDADIVKAESAGDVSDDKLKLLKEKRLSAKDGIVSHLAKAE